MATNSSICSIHGPTPPRSARRSVGRVCSFVPDKSFVRLGLSSSRVDLILRFPLLGDGWTSFDSDGTVDSGCSGGVTGSGADELRLSLVFLWLDHRPCMDLLSELEPCLSCSEYMLDQWIAHILRRPYWKQEKRSDVWVY